MTDTASTAGSQDFALFGPPSRHLADSIVPDYTDELARSLNDERAKARAVSCAETAERLWGEPKWITPKEWRWGARGSRSVNLEKNVWFDHEANEGGDTIRLVERELSISHEAATAWLLDAGDTSQTCRPNTNSPRDYQSPPPLGQIVATYDYLDETGTLLLQVVRYEPKAFRQRRPNGDGTWSWSVKDVRPVPYRLPELIEDVAERRTIVIVEGEKDVDNLRRFGIPATCNAGGARKWRRELTPHLQGADVVLIPDNDAAGCKHANDLGFALKNVASLVRTLDLPGLPEKGDVSDWFAAGHLAPWVVKVDRVEVKAALDLLVDYDWLHTRKILTTGRPALLYIVNPKILKR